MRVLPQASSRVWLVIPIVAAVFILWCQLARIERVRFVSGVEKDPPALDAHSATGYANGTRTLIVPAHDGESYDWIAQTQDLLERKAWRAGQVSYDNAPLGRQSFLPAPYFWYLSLLARANHTITGRPLGAAVETAALWAEPLLQLFLLVVASGLIYRKMGPLPAAVFAAGLASLFPFAAGFLPGAAGRFAPGQVLVLFSLLILVAGCLSLVPRKGKRDTVARRVRVWFAFAGAMGGLALWIDPFSQSVALAGISFAGMLAVWLVRAHFTEEERIGLATGWRAWGAAGAAIVFVGYLVECFPHQLGAWRLDRVHPLYGVGWVAAAELLAFVTLVGAGPAKVPRSGKLRAWLALALLLAAVIGPMVIEHFDGSFLPRQRFAHRLTRLPDAAAATDLANWIRQSGNSAQLWATLFPAVGLVPVCWSLLRGNSNAVSRLTLALAGGAVLAALVPAIFFLQWWQQFDGALLLAITVTVALAAREETKSRTASIWAVLFFVLLIPGFARALPPRGAAKTQIPVQEVDGLIERDLARWLAKRAGGGADAVVWAPPATTQALHFYGGLRGVGTLAEGNTEGLMAAVRIARAASAPEALALIQRRNITHLVLPSWDPYFEELMGAEGATGSFLGTLRVGNLPSWLRPVPYQFRKIGGIEDYEVRIFEVVDEQEPTLATSRRAEYLAEMGQLDAAGIALQELQQFPTDIGALAAQAQVRAAQRDAVGLAQVVKSLKTRLAAGGDRYLPWDRRISLAIVLARENEVDRAREQIARCLKVTSAERLRTLSPGMLLNYQLLLVAFETPIQDPALRSLARELLPFELRRHL